MIMPESLKKLDKACGGLVYINEVCVPGFETAVEIGIGMVAASSICNNSYIRTTRALRSIERCDIRVGQETKREQLAST